MVLLVFHNHQPFNRRRRSLPNHFFRNLILDTSDVNWIRRQLFENPEFPSDEDLNDKVAMGDQHYPSVKTQHVVILFEKPARPAF
jgi:hypothetical protein